MYIHIVRTLAFHIDMNLYICIYMLFTSPSRSTVFRRWRVVFVCFSSFLLKKMMHASVYSMIFSDHLAGYRYIDKQMRTIRIHHEIEGNVFSLIFPLTYLHILVVNPSVFFSTNKIFPSFIQQPRRFGRKFVIFLFSIFFIYFPGELIPSSA